MTELSPAPVSAVLLRPSTERKNMSGAIIEMRERESVLNAQVILKSAPVSHHPLGISKDSSLSEVTGFLFTDEMQKCQLRKADVLRI